MKIAFCLLSAFLFLRLGQQLKQAPSYGTEATYDAEDRVNAWLLSALCFQKTRVPLMICGPGDQIKPIEEVYVADDRGHALLATAAALFKSSPVNRVTLVRINLGINATGILMLALTWMAAGMPWTALWTLLLGSRYGIPGPIPGHDAPASYFGVFCLTATAVVWACRGSARLRGPGRRWTGGLAGAALVCACLLRQPIGLIGCMVVSGLLVLRRRPGVAVLMVGLALSASPLILRSRNLLFHIPPTTVYHSHGIWHTLYCGLGWRSNPWGIQWDDHHTARRVLEEDPGAAYGTDQYFRVIRRLYGRLVWSEPMAVLRIYGQKAKETWNFPLLVWGIHCSWLFLVSWVSGWIGLRARWGNPEALHFIGALGILYLVYFAQGILAIPTGPHLYPLKFGALLMIAAWTDVTRPHEESVAVR